MKIEKDNIFFKKKETLSSSISFLHALKDSLPEDLAFDIAKKAAANYIISYYDNIFQGTIKGSQNRFDIFRRSYEDFAQSISYCEVLISTSDCIKVQFNRCPYAEVLYSENLSEFSLASCLSDVALTKKFMPEIEFSRESSIVGGDDVCIMKWAKHK